MGGEQGVGRAGVASVAPLVFTFAALCPQHAKAKPQRIPQTDEGEVEEEGGAETVSNRITSKRTALATKYAREVSGGGRGGGRMGQATVQKMMNLNRCKRWLPCGLAVVCLVCLVACHKIN